MSTLVSMDENAVKRAYARWAPIYDVSFGAVAQAGREHAVEAINLRRGSVLEVGVGTGMSLSKYNDHLKITGIDLSPEMLAKARKRVAREKLRHVDDILEMDASEMAFEDDSFDTVVAMYVMTVVPDPDKVMAELERVCKPGGEVFIINHFSQDFGVRGKLEKVIAPFAELLGWRPEFPISRVMMQENLILKEEIVMPPLGLFTMLRFVKKEAVESLHVAENTIVSGATDTSGGVAAGL